MSVVSTNHMASGVHTEIEFPDRVSQFRRFGWGLYVEQQADPPGQNNNWFHIGIPYIQSDRREAGGSVRRLFLQMELNENARLAEIHLRGGRRLAFQTSPGIIGQAIDAEFDIPRASFSRSKNYFQPSRSLT